MFVSPRRSASRCSTRKIERHERRTLVPRRSIVGQLKSIYARQGDPFAGEARF